MKYGFTQQIAAHIGPAIEHIKNSIAQNDGLGLHYNMPIILSQELPHFWEKNIFLVPKMARISRIQIISLKIHFKNLREDKFKSFNTHLDKVFLILSKLWNTDGIIIVLTKHFRFIDSSCTYIKHRNKKYKEKIPHFFTIHRKPHTKWHPV